MTDWHLVHLGARAIGGAGLIIAEATAVSPEGRITPGCAGLWSNQQIEPLARVTHFLKQHGAIPGIQIGHAGRKASAALPWEGGAHLSDTAGGWPTMAPSPIVFGGDLTKAPVMMTTQDITRVREAFIAAASRALAAGCEWLEIHSAHGYLLHEYLSPLSNHRTDSYGGSFTNRIRFLLDTVKSVRAVWPERLPLAVRLSCTDWVPGGWDLDQSVELSRQLKLEGVDLIDCSSGGLVPNAKIPTAPGFQVPLSDRIRRESDIATAAVGLITAAAQANEIIINEQADLVLLAREMLRDPYWPFHAALTLKHPGRVRLPLPYLRAVD